MELQLFRENAVFGNGMDAQQFPPGDMAVARAAVEFAACNTFSAKAFVDGVIDGQVCQTALARTGEGETQAVAVSAGKRFGGREEAVAEVAPQGAQHERHQDNV